MIGVTVCHACGVERWVGIGPCAACGAPADEQTKKRWEEEG